MWDLILELILHRAAKKGNEEWSSGAAGAFSQQSEAEKALSCIFLAAVWCALTAVVNIWWSLQSWPLSEGAGIFFTSWQIGYVTVLLAASFNFWRRACWPGAALIAGFVIGLDAGVLFTCVFDDQDYVIGILSLVSALFKIFGMGLLLAAWHGEGTLKAWRKELFSQFLSEQRTPEEANRMVKELEEGMTPL